MKSGYHSVPQGTYTRSAWQASASDRKDASMSALAGNATEEGSS